MAVLEVYLAKTEDAVIGSRGINGGYLKVFVNEGRLG